MFYGIFLRADDRQELLIRQYILREGRLNDMDISVARVIAAKRAGMSVEEFQKMCV